MSITMLPPRVRRKNASPERCAEPVADSPELDRLRQRLSPETPADGREVIFGIAALAMWFLLFAGGVLIGTNDFITSLTSGATLVHGMALSITIFLFWTITNVGLLSLLAAVLGAFGARMRFTRRSALEGAGQPRPLIRRTPARELVIHYASAMLRGFGVFALVLSGLLVLATESLVKPDQSQYVRLAAMISVVAFYAGHDPLAFAGVLERSRKVLQPPQSR